MNPDPGIWGVKGKVYSLTHANNVVYAGGTFKTVLGPGGQKGAVLNLAAFNESTGIWIPTFAPTVENSTGKPVKVSALALSPDGSTLYLGGQFDTVDGQPVNNFAGVDAVTGAFDPSIDIHTNAGAVNVILAGPNLVYFGGAFTKVNGEDRGHLAAMNFDGTLNETWMPTTDGRQLPVAVLQREHVQQRRQRHRPQPDDVGGRQHSLRRRRVLLRERRPTSGHERNCIARVSATDGSLDPWAVPFSKIIDDAPSHKAGPEHAVEDGAVSRLEPDQDHRRVRAQSRTTCRRSAWTTGNTGNQSGRSAPAATTSRCRCRPTARASSSAATSARPSSTSSSELLRPVGPRPDEPEPRDRQRATATGSRRSGPSAARTRPATA